jgi:hypothetical protein
MKNDHLLRDEQPLFTIPATVTPRTQKFVDSLKKWCARKRGRSSEIARVIANGANSPQAREAVSRWFSGNQNPTGDQILAIQEFFTARETKDLKCPHCGADLDPKWVRKMSGRSLGPITGKRKARSPEIARKAAMARWSKKKPAAIAAVHRTSGTPPAPHAVT